MRFDRHKPRTHSCCVRNMNLSTQRERFNVRTRRSALRTFDRTLGRIALVSLISAIVAAQLFAQGAAAPALSATPAKKPEIEEKSPANKFFGGGAQSNEPTTTEIYANEAFFDSSKNMGIFTGSVRVTDPRFNLQSDKLTIYVSKSENQGLEKAIAEGSVAVVRDRPDPNGGQPTRSVGRAESATYVAATGNVELKGDPRVQEGLNTHVAASPETVMIINQNGQLTTHGPSRTEIRQQPKEEAKGEKKAEASPSPKP
jgi:lipopolysaccharide transport protein LptA